MNVYLSYATDFGFEGWGSSCTIDSYASEDGGGCDDDWMIEAGMLTAL